MKMSVSNFFAALSANKPHASLVIDVRLTKQASVLHDKANVQPVIGFAGCDVCLKKGITALLTSNPRFALLVRDCITEAFENLNEMPT